MNMKKPVLGAIGVAGACAACCAIPLAIPMIAGMSAGGLASVIGWDGLALSAIVPIGAGLGAALLVGVGLWWSRRRKAAACRVDTATAAAGSCVSAAAGKPAACALSCGYSGRYEA